jgi:hypothetical protein
MFNDRPTIIYARLEMKLHAFLTPIKYGGIDKLHSKAALYPIQNTVWSVWNNYHIAQSVGQSSLVQTQ